MIRIVGVHGEAVRACCQFPYKGYMVSMSSLMASPLARRCEVVIWPVNDSLAMRDFTSVESAIEWINNSIR